MPDGLVDHPDVAPLGLYPGAEVVFFGDSVTQDGHHVAALEAWFATAMPYLPLRLTNAGTGGNRAATALERLQTDVVARDPAVVFVQFGMNDGRYQPLDPADRALFVESLRAIIERLRVSTRAEIVLLGPPMYDRAARLHREMPVDDADYDETVGAMNAAAAALAMELGVLFVDVRAEMRAVTAHHRPGEDPDRAGFALSPDGIHPNAFGGFVIARALLDAWLGSGPAVELEVPCRPGVAETVQLARLPYPYLEWTRDLVGTAEWAAAFDRMTLRCPGLAEGEWRLVAVEHAQEIDLGTFDAAELSVGVDMTTVVDAPWSVRAAALRAHVEARRVRVDVEVRRPVQDLKQLPGPERCAAYETGIPAIEAAQAGELAALDEAIDALRAPFEVTLRVEPVASSGAVDAAPSGSASE
jgi:lysophospholipase L1-like esterase